MDSEERCLLPFYDKRLLIENCIFEVMVVREGDLVHKWNESETLTLYHFGFGLGDNS